MFFELQVYKKTSLDQRFVKKLINKKMSDQCIYALEKMPDSGNIVLDANNRATIVDPDPFEVINELDPSDSQLV